MRDFIDWFGAPGFVTLCVVVAYVGGAELINLFNAFRCRHWRYDSRRRCYLPPLP